MIDIHLVSWNRPDMTRLVIKTIARNTKRDEYKLHVFDNGSEASTQRMLYDMSLDGTIDSLLLSDENRGLEAARQYLLVEHADNEFMVCIDNDCLPPPDWLPKQLELMQKYEDYAAISQRTPVMIGTGNIFEQADENGMPIVDFPHPGGSFRMMRTDAVQKVGGWDRGADGRGQEERYICGKLREAGYGTAFSTHIQCLHLFGRRDVGHTTDRWGYPLDWKPEQSGHSDVWHPVLGSGDNPTDIFEYAGNELMREYYGADNDNSSNPTN